MKESLINSIKDNIGCVRCGDCKWFHVKADLEGFESTCKRLDHKKYRFVKSCFRSYDCGAFNQQICRDFEPDGLYKYLAEHWTSFDDWVGEISEKTKIGIVIDGNDSIHYYVKYKDFADGTFLDADGNLKWVERCFYKRCSYDKSPIGYVLVHETPEGR